MCPQPVASVVVAAVAPVTSNSNRINSSSSSNRRRHQQQQVASAKLFKKKLCVHPTTMFRIALKLNNGLIRSPKMVKYSAAPCRSCFTVSLPLLPLY